ncbi:MAG: 30S ribosomal protein S12 methylthiotransferase RimO [Planctomycetota bacterium]
MPEQIKKNTPDLPDNNQTPPLVAFVSLGCVKNLVDSEKMLGQIAESGAILCDEQAADTIVVNTCGFLGSARDEALDIIAQLAERKRAGTLRRLVVVGCLVQRDGETLLQQVPEIDALVGVHNRDDVARAIWPDSPPTHRPSVDCYLGDYHPQPWTDQGRLRLTPEHYAYVRIGEGCDQKCTFCTIPAIRGPLHCKTPDQIVAECQELIADGARELILIGQDTTSYGRDLNYQPGLAGLLRRLDAECTGARWLRLMYVYPSIMTDTIIDAIAECQRIVKYIDIPLQHINDRVLKSMGRRVTRRQTEDLLARIRARIPGVTLRTTFMVGFPGETEDEFAELLEFVRTSGFEAVGAFEFSREEGTPSYRLPKQITPEIRAARYDQLMLAQQEVALTAARQRIGQTFNIVVDEAAGASSHAIARHAGQAPEVDAVCLLSGTDAQPGSFMPVNCVGTDGYDLLVQPVTRPR